MAKKCPKCKKGAPGWMVTFGDMMALLLTFFVLLLSFAQLEMVKFKEVAGVIQDAFSIRRIQSPISNPAGPDVMSVELSQQLILVRLEEKLRTIIVSMVSQGAADMIQNEDGLFLRFNHEAVFLPGSMRLRSGFEEVLEQIGVVLTRYPNLIRLVGHTDGRPLDNLGPYTSHWAVSVAKAAPLAHFLTTRAGMDPTRLQIRGMAQTQPAASDGEGEPSLIRDSRVEIWITKETQAVNRGLILQQEDLDGAGRFIDQNASPAQGRNF